MSPTLSVVIPTYNRPNMLDRAIQSALGACADGDVEVIVVPNGPHDTWKSTKEIHLSNPKVKWLPIEMAHACAARNHGLSNANGKFIRFLDDDDYLLPAAARQLEQMEASGADISTAPLMTLDPDKAPIPVLQPLPRTNDFVCAALLSMAINNMTEGCIFLKSVIADLAWREDVVLHDDYLWILAIAKKAEINWVRHEEPVCIYIQHHGHRLSSAKRSIENSKLLVDSILGVHQTCLDQSRSTPDRAHAVATALLTHAHSAFPVSPLYQSSVIMRARSLARNAAPAHPLFVRHPWLARQMLSLQWMILPMRYLSRGLRRLGHRATHHGASLAG